jgi:serine/threonine protein kinase
VKLVDFGIFKLYNKIETNGTQSSNKGINAYVTLEVKFGEQSRVENNDLKFHPKVDLWSFAMTFENSD